MKFLTPSSSVCACNIASSVGDKKRVIIQWCTVEPLNKAWGPRSTLWLQLIGRPSTWPFIDPTPSRSHNHLGLYIVIDPTLWGYQGCRCATHLSKMDTYLAICFLHLLFKKSKQDNFPSSLSFSRNEMDISLCLLNIGWWNWNHREKNVNSVGAGNLTATNWSKKKKKNLTATTISEPGIINPTHSPVNSSWAEPHSNNGKPQEVSAQTEGPLGLLCTA